MTIIDRIKSIFTLRMGNRPSLRDPALIAFHGGSVSSAGVQVSESSALSYAPFWQAVRIISETISSLPFHVYQQTSSGRIIADDMMVADLLRFSPNEGDPKTATCNIFIATISLVRPTYQHLTYCICVAQVVMATSVPAWSRWLETQSVSALLLSRLVHRFSVAALAHPAC
jgi:hypothetical protein